MNYLIRDDGTVFPFDEEMAKRKDFRLMTEAEGIRYRECLKNKTKFVPDIDGESSPALIMSEWALDLSSGELLGATEAFNPASTIVLTADQANIVLVYKADQEDSETISLDDMTNAEMIEYAKKTYNITIPVNSNKAEIRAQINSAEFTAPARSN